jgi:SAM-dependent methyltransferase
MNRIHQRYCRSARWRTEVHDRLFPWALRNVDLSGDVLELGAGPGLTTDLLVSRAGHVTAIEIDSAAARRLAARLATEAEIVQGDATGLPFPDGRFDAVVAFTMFHHVPSPALQDRLFTEAHRVLRSGGTFAGTDSRTGPLFRLAHLHDTCVLVNPRDLTQRLATAGFCDVEVEPDRRAFRFSGRRP